MEDSIHPLNSLFNPKNVVIYEAKKNISFFIEGLKRQGFDLEKLYLVSDTEDIIAGVRCIKTFNEIPANKIDLLILSVKRELLIASIKQILSEKNINFIHIFTAGTGEFDDIGFEIERQLKSILESVPTRGIGPNCMGLYSPKGKTAYYSSFPIEHGNIGLIFQSGDLHSKMIKFGSRKYNLRFSMGISIGNCIDLQISEILDYFNTDYETDLVCVYFEGISPFHKNEGKRLLKILKSMRKPVLFMRGGRTERGQNAVVTHTGALATKQNIWNAIFKQTTAIEVPPSLDILIDYVYLFSNYIQRFKSEKKEIVFPENKRALVILWSGGFGILATDTFTELGLELPYFEGEKLEKLKEIYPIKIGSLSNPFDLPWVIHRKVFLDLCKAAIDRNIDLVVVETDAWKDLEGDAFQAYYNNLSKIKEYVESLDKIFIIVLHQYPSESRKKFSDMLINDGFLVYSNMEAVAKSFLKLYEYGKKIRMFM